jgi:hypothetical protein
MSGKKLVSEELLEGILFSVFTSSLPRIGCMPGIQNKVWLALKKGEERFAGGVWMRMWIKYW